MTTSSSARNGCPYSSVTSGVIGSAISKCPFLHNLSVSCGDEFARSIAINPLQPASSSLQKGPILEEYDGFRDTFKLFHGPSGVVPLKTAPQKVQEFNQALANVSARNVTHPLAHAPLASISFSLPGSLFNFGDMFRKRPKPAQKKKPERHQPRPPTSMGGTLSLNQASPSLSGQGQCPLRKALGPFAHVVFSKSGNLHCPEAIVQARAALAKTEVVRQLRPQELHVKLAAVAAIAAAMNVPCGAVREHFEKFSFGWFVAVHATIPFVAMFRKAVVMPKYAIILTIAAAVAGQVVGSRLERKRLAAEKTRGLERDMSGLSGSCSVDAAASADVRTSVCQRQVSGVRVTSQQVKLISV